MVSMCCVCGLQVYLSQEGRYCYLPPDEARVNTALQGE